MEPAQTPASALPAEDHGVIRYNARLGIGMFMIYLVIYAAFVLLSVFKLDLMAQPLAGVNVAIWYGFGLIIGAFVLAVIYLMLCKH